jgi:acyl carrier protein
VNLRANQVDDVTLRLIRCFAAVFPQLGRDEVRGASTATVEAWDSLKAITLLHVLEEEFGVSIEPEDLAVLESFTLCEAYLKSRLEGNGSPEQAG